MEDKHVKALNDSIRELQPLSSQTAAPASMQFQYVGTIVDNTLVLLAGAANSLDGGHRILQFSEFKNWRSVMQAVHRSFYSSVIISVEQGLRDFCSQEGCKVVSSRQKAVETIINKIEIEKGELSPKLDKSLKQMASGKPEFMDYVRSVTDARIDIRRRKIWEKFFEALTIVRNKSSHSDASLSEHEQSILNNGGLAVLVSQTGELQLNPRNYKQIIDLILRFYSEAGLAKGS